MKESDCIVNEALAALEKALAKEPSNGPFLYAMAALLAIKGKSAQAREYLKKAESLGVDGKILHRWLSANQEG